MGKGKKKNDKKKEEKTDVVESLSALSLSSPQPTTSQASVPQAEDEEEDAGLGLGGGRKKRQQKKSSPKPVEAPPPSEPVLPVEPIQQPPTSQVSAPATSEPTEPQASQVPTPATSAGVEKIEDEDDGLGLGGAKRKRVRKKKADPAAGAGAPKAPAPVGQVAEQPVPQQIPAQPVAPFPTLTAPLQQPAGIWSKSAVPGPSPSAPMPRPQAPVPPFQTQRAPQGSSQIAKPAPVQAQRPSADVGKPLEVLSRFKVPDKIIGNKVRSQIIQVLTNYLPMVVKPVKVHRYDVLFKPDRPKKALPLAFNTFLKKNYPKHIVAFDQIKNFYSMRPLKNATGDERFTDEIEIKDANGKQMKFVIAIKTTGVVDLNTLVEYMKGGTSLNPPTEAIQCVDVILRQGTLEAYVKAGRTFFRRPERPLDLGDGLEMWTGLFQSAIFTSRPFVNIDVAHKGFPIQQPLIRLLESYRLNTRDPLEKQNRFAVENFKSFLRGLKVMAFVGGESGLKREFICNGLVDSAVKQRFIMTDSKGKEVNITVGEYFEREKKCRLTFPHMSCVWVGPKEKCIYYPMELLDVSYGQVLNRQLNERQLSTMVREAATPPNIRKKKIDEIIRNMNYSKNPYFKEFQLEIKEEFHKVQARILPPPTLAAGGKTVIPRNGVWNTDRMLIGAKLHTWGIIAVERDARTANTENLVRLFQQCGSQMGMEVSPPTFNQYNVPVRQLQEVMEKARGHCMQLMLVVVPNDRRPDTYSNIKKTAERTVGLLTQCIKEQTLAMRMNPQTAKNILLKINSKLMGVNQALDKSTMPLCLSKGDVMVVGADVTHPSPDQTSVPSIAAVTASIDGTCFRYNIGLSIQTPKKEVIVEFEEIMVEHLRLYKEKMKALPKKIYVYRDGVSEGQFAQVMNSELVAIYKAYQTIGGNQAVPEVLFLLVQKRHHTRLFVGAESPQNVSPGTVVDTDIVHARELDFYLVSHAAIKGTARPTRYHAICNAGRLPHDEVEQLTYYLCHLYSRCSRSVSYPTPTYYAHLACLRARVLTMGEKFNNSDLEKKPMRLRVLENMLRTSPMFFV